MKILKTILIGALISTATIYADGSGVKMTQQSNLLQQVKEVDGFKVELSSTKPLIAGNNEIKLKIAKEQKPVEAKVKVKFFMPEMPGMPYMEFKADGKTDNGTFGTNINLSMGGTWQYIIKFKIGDEVHKVRGSVNL
ncbi:MAG TPA: hypothetical protein ENK74_01780 [Nitratifractor sp.]|nr:hypothetical protein [Nitratifractor sp.]